MTRHIYNVATGKWYLVTSTIHNIIIYVRQYLYQLYVLLHYYVATIPVMICCHC